MARDPLKPYRDAGTKLVGEVQQRLGAARDQGKSTTERVVALVQREVSEQLAARSVVTKADLARLESKVDALAKALAAPKKAGTMKAGAQKAGTKKASSQKVGNRPATKKASAPRASR